MRSLHCVIHEYFGGRDSLDLAINFLVSVFLLKEFTIGNDKGPGTKLLFTN